MLKLTWHLSVPTARLQLHSLAATIDLSRPERGIGEVRFAGAPLTGVVIHAVDLPSSPSTAMAVPAEGYVRGPDLAAVYEQSQSQPVRVDALWRAVASAAPGSPLAELDLLLSVRTSALHAPSTMSVRSELPANETLRLVDAGSAEYETLNTSGEGPWGHSPDDGPECLLFRIAGSDLSYAEMVHPADFQQSVLSRSEGADGVACIRHHLFGEQPLEKGVILRARVRGLLLARHGDAESAARHYREFVAAEPPLGT